MHSEVLVGAWCIFGGFGFYILHNTLQTKATEMYPQARGTAISVFAMSLFSGQAVGTIFFGLLTTLFGYTLSFISVGVCVLTLGLFFAKKLNVNLRRI
jgi:MFS family permease